MLILRGKVRNVAFFPSLKQNFFAYLSSKVSSRPDWIFEIHQQWQPGYSRVYSNSCCCCSFELEIIKISQSSHKMYNNNSEFSRVYNNFKCPNKNSLETYWRHHVIVRWSYHYNLWKIICTTKGTVWNFGSISDLHCLMANHSSWFIWYKSHLFKRTVMAVLYNP